MQYSEDISHASKVMLKILQARQYMNGELLDVQADFRKGRGTSSQIANICWIFEKAREFQKNIYFCLTDYAKAFACVDPNKLLKILKEIGIPDHFTCLLRNLYSGEEQQLVPDMEEWTGSKLERSREKAMAPHSSTLPWRIPGTGEPGGLPSMGSHRVRHD